MDNALESKKLQTNTSKKLGFSSSFGEVPALGVYRGGKSLLLNRLMQRRAPYANSFGVGHGQQTFTRRVRLVVLLFGMVTLILLSTFF